MLPIHQPNIEVHRIEMINGSREFCQEFMTDVIVPDTDRVGDVDEGWTVGTRWMFHERMLYNSPYVTEPVGLAHGSQDARIVYDIAREHGRLDDASVRQNIGEARMLELVVRRCRRVARGHPVGPHVRSGGRPRAVVQGDIGLPHRHAGLRTPPALRARPGPRATRPP